MNATHFATDFRGICCHSICRGRDGRGEPVKTRDQHAPDLRRVMAGGKVTVVDLKHCGVISLIVAATSDKCDKASIQ